MTSLFLQNFIYITRNNVLRRRRHLDTAGFILRQQRATAANGRSYGEADIKIRVTVHTAKTSAPIRRKRRVGVAGFAVSESVNGRCLFCIRLPTEGDGAVEYCANRPGVGIWGSCGIDGRCRADTPSTPRYHEIKKYSKYGKMRSAFSSGCR